MKEPLQFVEEGVRSWISDEELHNFQATAEAAKECLVSKKGAGNDFLGWMDLPVNYDKEELGRIKEAAAKIQGDSDVLLVIGIGGSYLGARAAIEFLGHSFQNSLSKEGRKAPKIYFCGNSNSSKYAADLSDIIGDQDFSINVISKSGTTMESAVAFRIFKKKLEEKYGKEKAAERIYVTTDKTRGALKKMADQAGYPCFVIPDDIGGRYSVLTAVGLLPIAVFGADVDALLEGAADMRKRVMESPFEENPSVRYAACRNILMRKGKAIEVLANYEPSVHYICEWWKQLYGESEGKNQRGLFPASLDLTTDLHSMGQYMQDGARIIIETVLNVENSSREVEIPYESEDLDGLNYLAGKPLDTVNKAAMNGTIAAHIEGGVPVMRVDLPRQDEYTLGQLFYFFWFACGVSGYIGAINPFDQPGVESYKKNMFAILKQS